MIQIANREMVAPETAWHYRVIPGQLIDNELRLYIDEQADESIKEEIEIILGQRVKLIKSLSEDIEKELSSNYLVGKGGAKASHERTQVLSWEEGNFMQVMIRQAQDLKSSDIHIEAYDSKCRIRFRLDGKLVELAQVKKADYPMLINRVKIMAGLDISEKRLPQDGRIHFKESKESIDIRVSVLPTLYGEKVVLRLLGTDASHLDIDDLGFADKDLERYKDGIHKPHGIILISGPTGSGKTTTLYATLKLLNRSSFNILTVEDPIEYTLEGINQTQVKEDIGLTFSRVLRSFLRQDPDIIMVGEIRDGETASLAVRAALTGHLVLSTIHTNSAWGTISRLLDMGVQSFLLSHTLNTSVAQRLLRVLCTFCKKSVSIDYNTVPDSFKGKLGDFHYQAVGCKQCHFTGYKGRRAIYEVIPITREVADLISVNSKQSDQFFRGMGVRTLQQEAISFFMKGETSFEEIYPFLLSEQF